MVSLAESAALAFSAGALGDLRGPLLLAALLLGLAELGLASRLEAAAVKLKPVLDAFDRTPTTADLAERLPAPRRRRSASGAWPASAAVCSRRGSANNHPQRQVVVVATTPGEAERWLTDLTLLTDGAVALYPQREALGEEEPHYEIAGERVETIESLLRGQVRIVITTARATAERTLMPAALERLRLRLVSGDRRAPAAVAGMLETMGYRRVATVTEVAEFSVRGGILDVYGFGMAVPARLEWWGDDITSIRGFDLTSQRSLQELEEVSVLPVSTRSLTDGTLPAEPAVAQDPARAAPLRYVHHPGVGRRRPGRGGPGLERSGASPRCSPPSGGRRTQA